MRLMNGAHFPPNVANLHAAPPNVSPHLPGALGLAFHITGSLSHLMTMLPESSSCPQPAQRPNHAT